VPGTRFGPDSLSPPASRARLSPPVILFRYILSQLATAALLATLALFFVVFPATAVSAVQKLGGVSLGAVLRYIPMVGGELLPYLLSLGFLLGVVTTFGRLVADREWVAILMAGIHPARLLLPGLVVAGVMGGLTLVLVSEVSPTWKAEQGRFRVDALIQSFRSLAPGRSEIDFGKFYLAGVQRIGDTFYDVQIVVPNPDGTAQHLVASSARVMLTDSHLGLALTGMATVKDEDTLANEAPTFWVALDSLVERRPKFLGSGGFRRSSELRAALRVDQGLRADPELAARVAAFDTQEYGPGSESKMISEEGLLAPKLSHGYRFELHSRWARCLNFLVFLALGVATGLRLGGIKPLASFGAASGYAFVYYVLSMRLGKQLAASGKIEPLVAAWSADCLGLLIGGLWLWKELRR
jgi:lipopolysaccharide export LptBFGC system permease protein LptF